jgi:Protein of unknown function (DUF2815)
MAERVKIEPKIITIHKGRISFLRTAPSYRTDKFGREVKVDPKTGKAKKPQWRMTWLLDPSEKQAQDTIAEIKAEAARQLDLFFNGRANWPKDNVQTGTKGVIPCFGNGNDLTKVYDGYKDMFFVKVSDTTEPIWGDRLGRSVRFIAEDGAWHILDRQSGRVTEEVVDPSETPYGGAYGRGRISLYVYNNEQAGVNANFRSVQFLAPGEAFGGGGRRNASDELAEMAGDAAPATAAASSVDPW